MASHGKLYSFGGYDASFTAMKSIEMIVYSPEEAAEWTLLDKANQSLPSPRVNVVLCKLGTSGNNILVAGGFNVEGS